MGSPAADQCWPPVQIHLQRPLPCGPACTLRCSSPGRTHQSVATSVARMPAAAQPQTSPCHIRLPSMRVCAASLCPVVSLEAAATFAHLWFTVFPALLPKCLQRLASRLRARQWQGVGCEPLPPPSMPRHAAWENSSLSRPHVLCFIPCLSQNGQSPASQCLAVLSSIHTTLSCRLFPACNTTSQQWPFTKSTGSFKGTGHFQGRERREWVKGREGVGQGNSASAAAAVSAAVAQADTRLTALLSSTARPPMGDTSGPGRPVSFLVTTL